VWVPGHGEVCGKGYVDEQGAFIQEWLDLVQGAIDRGMTKEEAVEKRSLLDRYPMDIDIDFMGPMVMKWKSTDCGMYARTGNMNIESEAVMSPGGERSTSSHALSTLRCIPFIYFTMEA
jgi:hypothetical protein